MNRFGYFKGEGMNVCMCVFLVNLVILELIKGIANCT